MIFASRIASRMGIHGHPRFKTTHILPTTGPITLELHLGTRSYWRCWRFEKKVQEKRPGLDSCLSHYGILCNIIMWYYGILCNINIIQYILIWCAHSAIFAAIIHDLTAIYNILIISSPKIQLIQAQVGASAVSSFCKMSREYAKPFWPQPGSWHRWHLPWVANGRLAVYEHWYRSHWRSLLASLLAIVVTMPNLPRLLGSRPARPVLPMPQACSSN